MRLFFYFLPILITLSFFSCDVTESSYTSSILPITVGNYWDYQLIQYKYDEVDSSIIYLDTSLVHMSVVKADTLESFAGFYIEDYIVYLGWDVSAVVFANKEDGLYIARRFGFFSPPPPPKIEKALSYPTFVGDSTNFDYYIIRTLSINEIINISSGSFKCIVYEVFDDNMLVGKLWLTPNVGIVKYWQLFGVVNLEYELKSYKLN
jgi:hypothetical protein